MGDYGEPIFMMRVLLCVAVLLAACAFAQRPTDPGCCSPWQWTGDISIINQFIAYDFKNQRARIDSISTDGRNVTLSSIIERFDTGNVYEINWETETCTYFNVSGEMPQACIPQGATHTFEFTLGAELPCRSYTFKIPPIVNTFVATADSCLPVSGAILGRVHGHYREADVFYFNQKVHVPEPGLFTPPTGCTHN